MLELYRLNMLENGVSCAVNTLYVFQVVCERSRVWWKCEIGGPVCPPFVSQLRLHLMRFMSISIIACGLGKALVKLKWCVFRGFAV